jgi:hypothetical protein
LPIAVGRIAFSTRLLSSSIRPLPKYTWNVGHCLKSAASRVTLRHFGTHPPFTPASPGPKVQLPIVLRPDRPPLTRPRKMSVHSAQPPRPPLLLDRPAALARLALCLVPQPYPGLATLSISQIASFQFQLTELLQ